MERHLAENDLLSVQAELAKLPAPMREVFKEWEPLLDKQVALTQALEDIFAAITAGGEVETAPAPQEGKPESAVPEEKPHAAPTL